MRRLGNRRNEWGETIKQSAGVLRRLPGIKHNKLNVFLCPLLIHLLPLSKSEEMKIEVVATKPTVLE